MGDVENDFHAINVPLVIVLLLLEPESINTHIAALDQVAGAQVQAAGVGIGGVVIKVLIHELGLDFAYATVCAKA